MAPPTNLYTLNAPQDAFWDFISSLNEPPRQQTQGATEPQEAATGSSSEKKPADKQPTVEDEEMAESSKEKDQAPDNDDGPQIPHRQHGGCPRGTDRSERPCHGRRGGRGGGWGYGGPPFMRGPPGGFPFAGPEGHPTGRPGGCRGRGPPPPPPPGHEGPPPHPFGPHGHPWHGPPRHGGPHRGGPGSPGFNLQDFLTNLGSRLGLDLSGAAENMGLNGLLNTGSSLSDGVDFEPRTDIFDTPTAYLLHLSLPGAKKSDLGVDWDGENSTIRVAGVVHRPNTDQEILSHLVVGGRKSEVGVFEKKIHLGTRRQPVHIDVANIAAKMVDGVLVVTVPKIEGRAHRREVPIGGSSGSPSPVRGDEKAGQVAGAQPLLIDLTKSEKEQEQKHQASEMDVDHHDARSQTEAGDHHEDQHQQEKEEELPQYHDAQQQEQRHEQEDSEEEADYVKIDVK